MPLDTDILGRVYRRMLADDETVEQSYASVGMRRGMLGTVEEYAAAIKKVKALVKGGTKWTLSVHNVANDIKPALKAVEGGKKPAKKAKNLRSNSLVLRPGNQSVVGRGAER